ncbi:MAG: AMIN domain-containing protein [Ruminococcaceae bacterium]|nr:AMIN domain-containing protein [Oscillospiraceae bacterium]
MKKTVLIVLIVTFLMSLMPEACFSATQYYFDGEWHNYKGNIFNLEVEGEILKTEMPPIVFRNYSVVPARDVFEKLGAKVQWKELSERVIISKGGTVLEMTINSKTAYLNGEEKQMQIPPKIINGKTMIPVRFVGDSFGYYVDFDSQTDTVIIRTSNLDELTYITKAKYSSEDDYLKLTLTTSGMYPVVNAFVVENPLRIVVDIKNSEFTPMLENVEFKGGNIKGIRYGQNDDARIVFDIAQKAEYKISTTDNKVVIKVYSEKTEEEIETPKPTKEPEPNEVPTEEVSEEPTEEPFSFEIKSSGGRDYVKVTSADVGRATRIASPISVTFEITGDKIENEASEIKPDANFVKSVKYKPISRTKAKVTLYLKDDNFNLVQTQSSLYIMAKKAEKLRSVMIDAGHGGNDAGAVAMDEDGNVYAKEKDFNLDVALRVQKILERENVEVKMIRKKDVYVDFQQVGSIANDADTTLFVSIHTNSALTEGASGIETWAYLEDNASSLNGMTGKRLAEIIQKKMIEKTNAVDRGIKNGKSLAVIKTTSMPAVLVEMGFISNKQDCENLMDESYRQKIAEAICEGILASFDEMGI